MLEGGLECGLCSLMLFSSVAIFSPVSLLISSPPFPSMSLDVEYMWAPAALYVLVCLCGGRSGSESLALSGGIAFLHLHSYEEKSQFEFPAYHMQPFISLVEQRWSMLCGHARTIGFLKHYLPVENNDTLVITGGISHHGGSSLCFW